MRFLICLTLVSVSCQSMRPSTHWCDQPTRKLRWLNRMIREIAVFPTATNTWEVHQAHYWGQEVFVVHLFGPNSQKQGFFLYNHVGQLVTTWERVDSVYLVDMIGDRMLVASPGRFNAKGGK